MVAIKAHQSEAWLRRLDPDIDAVLLYGPDQGMVREAAERLTRLVVDDPQDPFRVATLNAGDIETDPARLADEAAALSMTGGRRVVRVRRAGDAAAAAMAAAVDAGPGGALVVVEAGELRKGSPLRKLFETARRAAALPFYRDSADDLARVVAAALAEHGLEADREATAFLVGRLGNDRMITRSEIAKLAAYMGGQRRVGLADAAACTGDSAVLTLEDVAFAVADGDHRAAGRGLDRLALEGVSAIAVLRGVQQHFQRLHAGLGQIAAGRSVEQAMAALRPPPHFSRRDALRRQLDRWSPGRVATALQILTAAEIDCKSTGMPAAEISARALLRLTQAARPR